MSGQANTRSDRALRRLLRDEGALFPIDASVYGVYPHADRRRRATARLSEEEARRLVSDGALSETQDGFALTEAGAARARRSLDLDDAFRSQHQRRGKRWVADGSGALTAKDADLGRSPLERLRAAPGHGRRAQLSERAFIAGEKLRADHERAERGPRMTMDWTAAPVGRTRRGPPAHPGGRGGGAAGAQQRVEEALAALGAGLDAVVKAICLEARSLGAVEAAFGWPRRSARVVLAIALERLADHYGLAPER